MADNYLGYQNPTSVDAKLDTESLVVGANTVHRERVQIAGTGATDIALVGANGLYVEVRASALPTGASTSAKQDTGNTSVASIDTKTPALGQALAAASVPVVLTAAQITTLTPPAAITGFATSAKQDLLLTELQLKADLTETQPVSLAAVPSHNVTNAGTFAVQATPVTQADTFMLGGVNIKEINAVTPLMGNGVTGTGSQRVTIASDNTPYAVKIDQTTPGTTNLVAVSSISTSVTPGTAAANLGKAEDAGHTTGDTGVMMLGVRKDTASALAGTDADYIPPIMNARGATWVAIEDGAGGQITSFGGGTQYTEDAAAAADPVGTAPILVRKDTPAATVSTDGDNIAQRGTNYGAAYVTLLDTAGAPVSVGGGTQYTEDVAAAADPIGTMQMAVRRDTLSVSEVSADGDNIALKATSKGQLHVKQVDTVTVDGSGVTQPISAASLPLPAGAATSAKQDITNTTIQTKNAASPSVALQIGMSDGTNIQAPQTAAGDAVSPWLIAEAAVGMYNGSTIDRARGDTTNGLDVDVTRVIPGTTATALGKAEDAAHTTGDTGVMSLGVRNDSLTALTSTDGDYSPVSVDSLGRLAIFQITPGTAGSDLGKAEDAAHVSGHTGVMALAVRSATVSDKSAGGTDGDYEPLQVDANGALHMNMSYKLDSTNDSITTVPQKSATGTQTTVAGSATNVTLLASNSSRKGATIFNDSTAILYVRLQATATTSNFSVKMQPDDYYEVPFNYTGIIDGIWASATGNARITEMT